MRVAQFVQRYPPALGGAEAYTARLCAHLARRGHAVTVFTSTALDLSAMWYPGFARHEAGESAESPGVTVRRFEPAVWPLRRYLLKAASLVPLAPVQALSLPCNPVMPGMWREASRATGFDAVHASAFPYAFPLVCARKLARRLRVPFVLTPFVHLGDPADPRDRTRSRYLARPFRWLLRSADAVLVQTPGEADAVRDAGVPASHVILQGMGVDPAECTGGDRARARAAWGVADGEVVVGHLANHSVEKGTTDLLAAASRAWVGGAAFRLVTAGPTMPNFDRAWVDYPERARVRLLGRIDDAAKRDFFAGIDVFCLPSRSDSFGLVLLEAWANGVPCVGYRAGGVADVIRDGTDGRLVACGDIAGLADALTALAADGAARRRMGDAGREGVGRENRWSDKLAVAEQALMGAT